MLAVRVHQHASRTTKVGRERVQHEITESKPYLEYKHCSRHGRYLNLAEDSDELIYVLAKGERCCA
jgi:hypothetical protein